MHKAPTPQHLYIQPPTTHNLPSTNPPNTHAKTLLQNQVFSAWGYQPIEHFFFFLISAFLLIGWGELRKYVIRQYPTSWFAYAFAF